MIVELVKESGAGISNVNLSQQAVTVGNYNKAYLWSFNSTYQHDSLITATLHIDSVDNLPYQVVSSRSRKTVHKK